MGVLDTNCVELLFCCREVSVLEGHAGEAQAHLTEEVFGRQESFRAIPLAAVRVEDYLCRSPVDVESLYLVRMLANVELDGDEVLPNQLLNSFIGIDFGFQPNASASLGRRAEVEQNGLTVRTRLLQAGIQVGYPFDCWHFTAPPTSSSSYAHRIAKSITTSICLRFLRLPG